MVRIAVMGDNDSIKGFSAVGLDIFPCEDTEKAGTLLRSLAEGEYGIIYITEELFGNILHEVKRYDEQMSPAIVPIPGVKGNTGIGVKRLSESVEKAVGSDIIFGGNQ